MSVCVAGMWALTALGEGLEAQVKALNSERTGLRRWEEEEGTPEWLRGVYAGRIEQDSSALARSVGLPEAEFYPQTAVLASVAGLRCLGERFGEHSSWVRSRFAAERIGLVLATSAAGMAGTETVYKQLRRVDPEATLGLGQEVEEPLSHHSCGSTLAYAAEMIGIGGYRTCVSTACSSGANAVVLAAEYLQSGRQDAVLVIGAESLTGFTVRGFRSLRIYSDGACHPHEHRRDGLNLGEGVGALLLCRQEDVPDSITVWCSLRGAANANDAFHPTASSDDGEGLYQAMNQAIDQAGLSPQDIDYINLHGTGTQNNDSSEREALRRVFGEGAIPPCAATKAYTGHTLGAAGAIEAVYTALALKDQYRFGQPDFESSELPLVSPGSPAKMRYALSLSAGFGGNCTALLFEAPERKAQA